MAVGTPMSPPPGVARVSAAPSTVPSKGGRARLVMAAGALFTEYLALSHMVDARTVAVRGGVWLMVAHLGAVGPALVTTAAAWFMLYRLRPASDSTQRSAYRETTHPSPVPRVRWLLVHLVAFAVLLSTTRVVFGPPEPPRGPALAWLALWAFLVTLVFVSVLLAILGGARWLRVLPRDLRVAGPVGVLAWLGGLGSAALWESSSDLTLPAVAELLTFLSSAPSTAIPERVLLVVAGRVTLSVSSECSGHEGFGLFLVLTAVYLVASRRELRLARVWPVLPTGLLVVWVINVLRFSVLSWLGVRLGPAVAVASFHSKASWVLFCTVAVLGATLVRRFGARKPLRRLPG